MKGRALYKTVCNDSDFQSAPAKLSILNNFQSKSGN